MCVHKRSAHASPSSHSFRTAVAGRTLTAPTHGQAQEKQPSLQLALQARSSASLCTGNPTLHHREVTTPRSPSSQPHNPLICSGSHPCAPGWLAAVLANTTRLACTGANCCYPAAATLLRWLAQGPRGGIAGGPVAHSSLIRFGSRQRGTRGSSGSGPRYSGVHAPCRPKGSACGRWMVATGPAWMLRGGGGPWRAGGWSSEAVRGPGGDEERGGGKA